jgi:hypothetical protein
MAVAPAAGVVVVLFMALPFFVESAPRAYRLKAGNADPILFNIPRDIPGMRALIVFACFVDALQDMAAAPR